MHPVKMLYMTVVPSIAFCFIGMSHSSFAQLSHDENETNKNNSNTTSNQGQNKSEVLTNSIGMKFKPLPGGTFTMGENDEAHEVTLTKSFAIGINEVTQKQWRDVMNSKPWQDDEGNAQLRVKEGDDFPATYVSWEDAVKFCKKLSELEDVEYRLPTEAEWEYACRGGTSTTYSFGDSKREMPKYARYDGTTYDVAEKFAHAVGQKLPNPFGLYDMHGNVNEWCNDWYAADDYGTSPSTDPLGPKTGEYRVFRGGSWIDLPERCRSAFRQSGDPGVQHLLLGFRVVRSSKSTGE